MAIDENTKSLIYSVLDNDLAKAKNFIKVIIENDTTVKNQYFCKNIKSKLETQHNFLELPWEVKGLITMEDVSTSFNRNRYFLTERENKIFEQIHMAKNTNSKLTDMGIRYLNTTLLYGESGTGKTTFGRYIAYKLGLPFAYLNFSHCIDSHLGETGKNIAKVFDYISKQKCVLMLDEIDAIGLKRSGNEGASGEMSRIVIGLMQAFDLLENDIVIIGATNRKDMIDKALIRRFTLEHEITTLTKYETKALIMTFLHDLNITCCEANIEDYASKNNKQSEIMNDITKAIIKMLNEKNSILYIN